MPALRSAASRRNLCRRNLAGGHRGGLRLAASSSFIITKWVLPAAEGGDHAVTELEESTKSGESTYWGDQGDKGQLIRFTENSLFTSNGSVAYPKRFLCVCVLARACA